MTVEQLSPSELRAVLDQVAQRYAHGSRFTQRYTASKLRKDPVHRVLLERAVSDGFGQVLDLGCGRGQLALALLEGTFREGDTVEVDAAAGDLVLSAQAPVEV